MTVSGSYLSEGSYRHLSARFGTVVKNIDLRDPQVDWSEVQDLLVDRKLLIFRNQNFDAPQLQGIASKFGEIVPYPFASGVSNAPGVTRVINEPDQHEKFSSWWHADSTFLDNPPDISLLFAVELPESGGDTVVSDAEEAFDTLSVQLKSLFSQLSVRNSSAGNKFLDRNEHFAQTGNELNESEVREAVHDLVSVHPDSGRKSLAANMEHSVKIPELSSRESASLLRFLFEHISQHEFTTRIHWRPGTLAILDNRCTQHRALNDYVSERREMLRVMVETP